MGTLRSMSEPSTEPTQLRPRQVVGDTIECPMRVHSDDYGAGTVVAILGHEIQVLWDKPLTGTSTRMLAHQRSFVRRLERL